MMWNKVYLETRWRLLTVLVIALAAIAYYELGYPSRQTGWVETVTAPPFVSNDFLENIMEEEKRSSAARSLEAPFSFYVHRNWFRELRSFILVGGAILVGLIGLGSERSRRTIMATLSLPMRRSHMVLSQAGAGMTALILLTLTIDLAALVAAIVVGEELPVGETLRLTAFAILGQGLMFSVTLLASTLFDDMVKPMASALLVGLAINLLFDDRSIRHLNLYFYMGGGAHAYNPGTAVTMSLVLVAISAVLVGLAATLAQRKEY